MDTVNGLNPDQCPVDRTLRVIGGRWKALKGQGANLAYWRQTDEGRWEKAA